MLMKLLLVALNAKYIHSNLAVYSLKSYAKEYADYIEIAEFTINQADEEVLRGIYRSKADIVAFSCYIWNISMVKRIINQLKKICPQVKVWLGGPEVSFHAEDFLRQNPAADGIVIGEGEQTFLELVRYYLEENAYLDDIAGLVFAPGARTEADKGAMKIGVNGADKKAPDKTDDKAYIVSTGQRLQISLDSLPFPYEDLLGTSGALSNRIIYYESSRGCPYSCSYCLSSIDKGLRFRDISLVKKELKAFIDHGLAQVKFVDRTFNCSKKHAMEIWSFIREHDNGMTNFHFEISADLLDNEELELLSCLRPGQVQFEIGVQTTNPDSLQAIHRRMDLDRLSENVRKLRENNNIHLHLDLIAGLPLEDYASFEKSFNYVYSLKPHQLQLGFLKVLKGSCMEKDSARYGIIYREEPPYEVLYTDCLSFDEMLKLKGICEMVELYFNSGQFSNSIGYLEHFFDSPMKLYEALHSFYEKRGLEGFQHSRIKRYEILLDFFRELMLKFNMSDNLLLKTELFKELLIYDLCLRENLKSRPGFDTKRRNREEIKRLYDSFRSRGSFIHIETFGFDIRAAVLTGELIPKKQAVIFDYDKRDPLSNSAKVDFIDLS